MITSLFLKNFKIYKKTKFVPISARQRFCAFVGPNGAGKSSILEALDTYFNGADWVINNTARKQGETTNFINLPFVCPVFCVEKAVFDGAHAAVGASTPLETVRSISDFLWTVTPSQIPNAPQRTEFLEHRDRLVGAFDVDHFYLLVAGIRHGIDRSHPHFGPFHQQQAFIKCLGLTPSSAPTQLEMARENDEKILRAVGDLNETLWHLYNYVYIPSDVSIADYTRLETTSMQLLMGRDVNEEIKKALPDRVMNSINESLESTVAASVAGLPSYTYDKPKGGKKKIAVQSLSRLITRDFFAIRELSRVEGGNMLTPVSRLSSGEQRRALIDVTANYLMAKRALHAHTVFAIDEPEISLHTSLCFDQFEKLFAVARGGVQTLLTTHWYGFLPIAQDGNAHFVEGGASGAVSIASYDLSNYREKAAKQLQESKGTLPFDISLKSANDLVQSIASSLRLERPYSWILCEGSSEMIYLSHFLAGRIEAGQLRILPLGGAGEVLKLYRHLEAALADKTFSSDGRVVALVDTDTELITHKPSSSIKSLVFRRLLLNKGRELQLVPVDSNHVSPATAIEDCLNPARYISVLDQYTADHGIDLRSAAVKVAVASGAALDLKASERTRLDEFFKVPGRKTEFARAYVDEPLGTAETEPLVPLLLKLLK